MVHVAGCSAHAGRLRGLRARGAKKRMGWSRGPDANLRREGDSVGVRLTRGDQVRCRWGGKEEDVAGVGSCRRSPAHGSRSWHTVDADWWARLTQLAHGTRSFGAFGARCTQFCPTVHADEVRCTQFFADLEATPTSSTCGFTASRSFWGLRNCVYRTPFACSAGQNCVYHTSVACSVKQNCVYHAPFACSVKQNCVQRAPKAPKLRVPCANCVNRAKDAQARTQRPPHPLPSPSRQQPNIAALRKPNAVPSTV